MNNIEELREAYRVAKEAHAEAVAIENKADCARANTGAAEVIAERALDGSVEAERTYIAALEAERTAYDAWNKARATKLETEHSCDKAEREYKEALRGQLGTRESTQQRFVNLTELNLSVAKNLLAEFNADRFSEVEDVTAFAARLTEIEGAAEHRGSSDEVGTRKTPTVNKGRNHHGH